jgi:hypothetical protein
MADGVDAAMEAVKSPTSHPAVDISVTQPELQQLRPGHHAVLRIRDGCDQRVLGAFSSHSDD